jgi:hypothetical protein
MSGNRAYLRELNASNPATLAAIQKPSVSQGYLIASREMLKRSLNDAVAVGLTIPKNC